jgi:hypothetical protein
MRWSIEGQGDKRFFQEMVDARSPSTEALDPAIVAFLGRLRSINSIEDLDTWYQALKPLFAYVLTTRPKPVQEPASSSDPAS